MVEALDPTPPPGLRSARALEAPGRKHALAGEAQAECSEGAWAAALIPHVYRHQIPSLQ